VSAPTINRRFGQLCRFFERLVEWGDADAPATVLVLARHRRHRAPATPERQRSRRWRTADVTDRSLSRGPPTTAGRRSSSGQRRCAATMTACLEQLVVSFRPGRLEAASLSLREFDTHRTRIDPACVSVPAVERRHVECQSSPSRSSSPPGRAATAPCRLRRSQPARDAAHLVRAGHRLELPRRPAAGPVFAGDLPKADEPLPKFLDVPTAAKFVAVLATEPHRRRRLIVLVLARTGMRWESLAGCVTTPGTGSATPGSCASTGRQGAQRPNRSPAPDARRAYQRLLGRARLTPRRATRQNLTSGGSARKKPLGSYAALICCSRS
jgi:hypothetical protein